MASFRPTSYLGARNATDRAAIRAVSYKALRERVRHQLRVCIDLTRLATISAKVTNFTRSIVSTAYQQMDHAPAVDDAARQNAIIAKTLVGGVALGQAW